MIGGSKMVAIDTPLANLSHLGVRSNATGNAGDATPATPMKPFFYSQKWHRNMMFQLGIGEHVFLSFLDQSHHQFGIMNVAWFVGDIRNGPKKKLCKFVDFSNKTTTISPQLWTWDDKIHQKNLAICGVSASPIQTSILP